MKNLFITLVIVFPFVTFSQNKKLSLQEISAKHFNSSVKILLFDSIANRKDATKGFCGRGSGFIVTEDGLIFTNKHVVLPSLGLVKYSKFNSDKDEIYSYRKEYKPTIFNENLHEIIYVRKLTIIVQIFDDTKSNANSLYIAKVLAIDTNNFDGAILQLVSKINGEKITGKFNPVKLGNSDPTERGNELSTLAFPANYDDGDFKMNLADQSTQLSGRLTGFDYGKNPDYGLITTDIDLNKGNSGGPIFNDEGLVIGLASAEFTKTQIGIIFPINGMYNIAKNDFALLNKLKAVGLQKPSRSADVSGIINDPTIFKIPTDKRIQKYNYQQHQSRKFIGGFFYLKFAYTLPLNLSTFSLLPREDFLANSTAKLDVKHTSSFSAQLGKSFPLWRMDNFQKKLSLDVSFNVNFNTKSWSNAKLFSNDSLNNLLSYNPKQNDLQIAYKIGLMYSFLIKEKNFLDIYYNIGIISTNSSVFSNGQIASYSNSTGSNIYFEDNSYINSFGINYHVKLFTFGLEYIYGKSLYSRISGILDNNSFSGTTDFEGINTTNQVNITLGATLFNNKKWKKFY